MTSHHAALLGFCCCEPPPDDCFAVCVYIVVDGGWVFLPNSPNPDCGVTGECGCASPEIGPECPEQIATCECIGNSESVSGLSCVYTSCDIPP